MECGGADAALDFTQVHPPRGSLGSGESFPLKVKAASRPPHSKVRLTQP
jgi:hypothetical protein